MRTTLAFLAYELRTQARSLRFRLIATAYLALTLTPVGVHASLARKSTTLSGAASYAAELFAMLPTASAILAVALGLDAILREREEGAWAVVTLAPLSNAGYLLRRWLAVLGIQVGLSGVAVAAAAGIAAAAGTPPTSAGPFVGPWLATIVPILAGFSAAALGLGTIADSAILGGILLLLAINLVPGVANDFLARSHRKLSRPLEALRMEDLQSRIRMAGLARTESFGVRLILPATEGPYDGRTAAGLALGLEAVPLGAALALLALAAPFLRRSRADLRPWSVSPTHPLRSYLALANRLRQRYAPDARAHPIDLLLGAAGALALAAGLGTYFARDAHYRELAGRRHRVENRTEPGTSAAVETGPWTVTADLAADGRVRSAVEATFVNAGTSPVSRLAFELNPGLDLAALTAEHGTARPVRRYNRLEVTLAPPLAPAEARRLSFRLAGTPFNARFNFRAPLESSFEMSYRFSSTRRFAADLADLAASSSVRAISPRRVELAASDLLPMPRYLAWELTPPPAAEGASGLEILPENSAALTDLRFDLRAPAGLVLAEACGTATWGGGRLAGRCLTPLAAWAVRGGRLVPVAAAGLTLGALPAHRERARFHAASLAQLSRQAEDAWPGLALPAPVLLEWPPPFGLDPFAQMGGWMTWDSGRQPQPVAVGRLLLLPEHLVAGSQPIPSAGLAGQLVAGELLRRRPLARSDRAFLNDILRAVAQRRLGRGPAGGAVLTGRTYDNQAYHLPLLEQPEFYYRSNYDLRLAAVLVDLEHRVGAPRLQRAIEEFLSRRGAPPGTVSELLSTLGRTTGLDLGSFYRDYFTGSALPDLTLAGVTVERGSGGYMVSGTVENRSDGEAWCPVVVSTELAQVATEVRVGSGAKASWRLVSPYRPSVVRLDPDNVCHRFRSTVPGQNIERVELSVEAAR